MEMEETTRRTWDDYVWYFFMLWLGGLIGWLLP